MKITRPVVCLALVASVIAAGSAGAATKPKPKPLKPVCNLITDAAGDASLNAPAPSDDALDILSADVASDAKSFTAVIRVKNISAAGVNQIGHQLEVDFDLAGAEAQLWLGYSTSAYGGDVFQYGLIGKGTGGSTSPTGDAAGVVDKSKNEVRITVPVADLNGLGKVKPGAKVSNLVASATQFIGVAPNATGVYGTATQEVDNAAGTKAYIAGYPSCVKPGA